ncbi:MAG: EAL domain-containing protein [Raoultibacter sp.]
MLERAKRSRSLRMLVVIPCCIALVLQSCLYFFGLAYTGSVQQMETDSYSLFSGRITSRSDYLENLMVQRWSNIGSAAIAIERSANNVLSDYGATPADISTGSDLAVSLVDASAASVIECLRSTETSGTYLVLRGGQSTNSDMDSNNTGIYIRDANPKENYDNNSDLLLGRCPTAVAKRLGLALDSNWTPNCMFAADKGSDNDFYYKPLVMAEKYPQADGIDLGYWAPPHDFADNGKRSITYSMPLRAADGTVFGVLGIEIALDRVMALFPYEELDKQGSGSYLFALAKPSDVAIPDDRGLPMENVPRTYELVDGRGGSYASYTDPNNRFFDAYLNEEGRMSISSSSKDSLAYASKLSLYGTNSPYADESWVVIGLDPEQSLFASAHALNQILLGAFVFSLVIGLILALSIGFALSSKLTAFMQQVRTRRPDGKVTFTPTNVLELDELAAAIEVLSADVASSASRLTQIIRLSNRRIGAFEYDADTEAVFYAGPFFDLLGVDDFPQFPPEISRESIAGGTLDAHSLARLFEAYKSFMQPYPDDERCWTIDIVHRQRIVRLRLTSGEATSRVFGLLEDVTEEITARRRIEDERDHDILTGLLNRRAFESSAEKLLAEARRKSLPGIMIMFDLDGLKSINDSYGHDWGDGYITRAGDLLRTAVGPFDLASRISGDEFLVLIIGNRSAIAATVARLQSAFEHEFFNTPDGTALRVRASMGSARFPEDASDFAHLREYADFAMYTAKNTRKGELCAFDYDLYQKKSYLLSKKEDLNRLLDEVLVDYHFQSIIDARTGDVFGYEALMRPRLKSLPTPDLVLDLARSQSKLYRIEHITFFESLKAYSRFGIDESIRLFVNTIGTQCLSSDDIAELTKLYPQLLKSLVVEITESEYGRGLLEYKRKVTKRWGAAIAIDDFGTGYNSDVILLENVADFVKVDISIIANITHDADRQAILLNLLGYAHERGIKVIAEGVENKEQLETLIGFGIDYIQGYLTGRATARPSPADPEIVSFIRLLNQRA